MSHKGNVPVRYGCEPKEGRRAVQATIDLTEGNFSLDLTQLYQRGQFQSAQTVYIDNSLNTGTVTLTLSVTKQSVTLRAGQQGYIPILEPVAPDLLFSSSEPVKLLIQVLNFVINPAIWDTATLSADIVSVGLDMPPQFEVSNSPLLPPGGTIDVTWNDQDENTVLAGPATGAPASPTFRALIENDIIHSYNSTVTFNAGIQFGSSGGADVLDFYETGSWTPSDASGAGLIFVGVSCIYCRIGSLVFVSGVLSYPNTSNADAAAIGGLPFPVNNSAGANAPGPMFSGISVLIQGLTIAGSSTFEIFNGTTAAAITNAQLSNQGIRFAFMYSV